MTTTTDRIVTRITYGRTTLTLISPSGYRGRKWQSARWSCDVCGRVGYGDEILPGPWSETCARGHHPCPWCGRQVAAIRDGEPRIHVGCKDRPKDLQDDWDGAKTERETVRLRVATGVINARPNNPRKDHHDHH